jgi:hypothetical protein
MSPVIIPATMVHVDFIASRMREADALEAWAIARFKPREALEYSLAKSLQAWTWMQNGEPACMWGVDADSILGPVGHPWLLTTSLVDRYPITFLRGSLNALKRMQSVFPELTNWVDARHVVCVRWLRWLGFAIEAPVPLGPFGLPFHRFTLRA